MHSAMTCSYYYLYADLSRVGEGLCLGVYMISKPRVAGSNPVFRSRQAKGSGVFDLGLFSLLGMLLVHGNPTA